MVAHFDQILQIDGAVIVDVGLCVVAFADGRKQSVTHEDEIEQRNGAVAVGVAVKRHFNDA